MNAKFSILDSLLDTIRPHRIAEFGMQDLQRSTFLLRYCKAHNCTLDSVDLSPAYEVQPLHSEYENVWTISKQLGLNAISVIQRTDIVILDEDHNWYTTHHCLLNIQRQWNTFPIVLVLGSGNPNSRKDAYRDISRIPMAYRQPLSEKTDDALYANTPQNGVKTGIEDFIKQQQDIIAFHLPVAEGFTLLASSTMLANTPSLRSYCEGWAIGKVAEAFLEHEAYDKQELERLQSDHQQLQELTQKLQKERDLLHADLDKLYGMQGKLKSVEHALVASNSSRIYQGNLLSEKLQEVQTLLVGKQMAVDHVLNTLSWKLTAPLRQIGHVKRILTPKKLINRCMYAVFGALKDLWTDFGKPFPRATRFVRYRLLRKWKPHSYVTGVVISEEKPPAKTPLKEIPKELSDRKNASEKSPPTVVEQTTAVIVYGESHSALQNVLQSITAQSLPVPHIAVLYSEPTGDIDACMKAYQGVSFQRHAKNSLSYSASNAPKLPYVCLIPQDISLHPNAIQSGSDFLEENKNINAVTWNINDDIPATPIAVPLDEAFSHSQPVLIRSKYLRSPEIKKQSGMFIPVSGSTPSTFYPAPQIT